MEHFWTFFVFCISACVTPGPNNIMLLTSSLNFGVRRTLPQAIGIIFGFSFLFAVLGLGLGTLFERYEGLHYAIKLLGSVYMLYLAFKIATSHTKIKDHSLSKPISLTQAFFLQWVNPKAWVVGVSSMASYTSISSTNHYLEIGIIVLTYFFVLIPSSALWILGGASLRNFLKHERYRAIFNYTMGGLLALSVVLLFI